MSWQVAFSTSVAESVLRSVCTKVRLDFASASLLRLGENAIYGFDDVPVVVRIARSADRMGRVEREVCMARWLRRAGVPAVEVNEELSQPILVEGHPVTFWGRISERRPKPRHVDLALLLRQLHDLGDSPCEFPAFMPLGLVEPRINAASDISTEDRAFILKRYRQLSESFQHLEFALPTGPIHGDAWLGNLLRDDAGQVRLLDFEMAATGPREWDLIPTAIATSRYGLSKRDYQAFCRAYGFDVTTWPGYSTLREIRELTMTTWVMQNIGESPTARHEFQLRINSIRRRDLDRAWGIL